MNISDINATLTSAGRGVAVAKKPADVSAQIPVPSGNSLPEPAQSGGSVSNASPSQPNTGDLHSLVAQANNAPIVRSSTLEFSVDEGTDIDIIRIKDSETGEVIRQIPSEAMMAIARALTEQSQGTILKEKA